MTNKDKIRQDIKTYEKYKRLKNLGNVGLVGSLGGLPIAGYKQNKPAAAALLGTSFLSGFVAKRSEREERAALNRIKRFYDLRDTNPMFNLPEILPLQEKRAATGIVGAAAMGLGHALGINVTPAEAVAADFLATPAMLGLGLWATKQGIRVSAKRHLGQKLSPHGKAYALSIAPLGGLKTLWNKKVVDRFIRYKPKSERVLNEIIEKQNLGQELTPPQKILYGLYKKHLAGEKLPKEQLKRIVPSLPQKALQKVTGGLAYLADYPFQFFGPFAESQHIAKNYVVPAHKFLSKYSPKHADLMLDVIGGGQKGKDAITKLKMDKIDVDNFIKDLGKIRSVGKAAENADRAAEDIVKKYFLPEKLKDTSQKMFDIRNRSISAAKMTGLGVGAGLTGSLLGSRKKKNKREEVASHLALMK
ncbi:MAG: hypothetical protein EBZ49_00170 [Proteobacteria bacterium]|nr:hypothetical protein [Pseudomonadota bacterium]